MPSRTGVTIPTARAQKTHQRPCGKIPVQVANRRPVGIRKAAVRAPRDLLEPWRISEYARTSVRESGAIWMYVTRCGFRDTFQESARYAGKRSNEPLAVVEPVHAHHQPAT